ncbi:MAG: hypothetical protein AAF590_02580 [Pseudomonadota bacterium]
MNIGITAEALIGYSEAGFLAIGLLAILLLIARVYHPANRATMNDHATSIFRGEDAPDPRPDGPTKTHTEEPSQNHAHGRASKRSDGEAG